MDVMDHIYYRPGKVFTVLEIPVADTVRRRILMGYYTRLNWIDRPIDENHYRTLIDRFDIVHKPTDLHLYYNEYHKGLSKGITPARLPLEHCTIEYRLKNGLE